jgi:hypothetical protein
MRKLSLKLLNLLRRLPPITLALRSLALMPLPRRWSLTK